MAGEHQQFAVATACVTATAAVNTGLTLTVTAAGASKYQHFTKFQFTRFVTALAVATSVPIEITTTNLAGDPAFWIDSGALAAGTESNLVLDFNPPLRSAAFDTNTTFVAPAQAQTRWRMAAWYF